MKTQIKSVRKDKNIDLLLSMLSEKEILNVRQMICVRGGDGDTSDPPIPPIKTI